MDDLNFPSRKEILDSKKNLQYRDKIIDQIKSVDVEKIDFSQGNFRPRTQIVEKQKVFFWIRLFLKEENISINPNDTITIEYLPSGEKLDVKFICYNKKGLNKNNREDITNYNSEDDKKVFCLMVDSDRINNDSEDIPFIRTLFKIGKYYDYQLLKRDELIFKNQKNGEIYEYYGVEF